MLFFGIYEILFITVFLSLVSLVHIIFPFFISLIGYNFNLFTFSFPHVCMMSFYQATYL